MATPNQTFDRVLEGLAGDALNAGGFKHIASGALDSSVTADPIDQGRVVHLYAASVGTDYADPTMYRPAKKFRPGALGKQYPYIVIPGTRDLDAQGVVDASAHGYATTTGTNKLLTGLSCLDSVEVATREFDTAQTYAVNDPLRGVRHDSASNAGTLTNQTITWGTQLIIGQCTSAKTKNIYGKDVLHFNSMYQWGTEAMS